MKDLVLLLCWLYRGCADACFEHVVVAATHYDRTNASLALRTRLLDAQAAAKARWLPAGLVVVVENDVVERSRIEVERRGLAYARNGGYPGHGFELGLALGNERDPTAPGRVRGRGRLLGSR